MSRRIVFGTVGNKRVTVF